MTRVTITPNKRILTSHADAAGYEWWSGILGDSTASEFIGMGIVDGKDKNLEMLIDYLQHLIGEGFYTRKADWDADNENATLLGCYEFTPAQALADIRCMARDERGE